MEGLGRDCGGIVEELWNDYGVIVEEFCGAILWRNWACLQL